MNNEYLLYLTLFLFFLLGIFFREKSSSVYSYAIGRKKYSRAFIVATMVSTAIGSGSILGFTSSIFEKGICFLIPVFFEPLSCFIIGYFFVPKFTKWYGSVSIGDIMGKMYGVNAKKFVGIFSVLLCFGTLSAQLKGLSWTLENIFSLQGDYLLPISTLIIIVYSAFGGASAIVKTDLFQLIIVVIMLPIVASNVVINGGGIQEIFANIPTEKMNINTADIWGIISLSLYFLLPSMQPYFVHRLLIGGDTKENTISLYALAISFLCILIFVSCIAFIGIAKFPNAESKDVLFLVINNFFEQKWIIGAFGIALIAVIFSTADSVINTGAVAFVNDVYEGEITEIRKVLYIKIFTILSGFFALGVSIYFSGIFEIILFFAGYYGVIVTVPMLFGLYESNNKPIFFWCSAIAGLASFSVVKFFYSDFSHVAYLFSISLSALLYVLVKKHYHIINENKILGYIKNLHDNMTMPTHIIGYVGLIFFVLTLSIKIYSAVSLDITRVGIDSTLGSLSLGLVILQFSNNKHTIFWTLFKVFSFWYIFFLFPIIGFIDVSGFFGQNELSIIILFSGIFILGGEGVLIYFCLAFIASVGIVFFSHNNISTLHIRGLVSVLIISSGILVLFFLSNKKKNKISNLLNNIQDLNKAMNILRAESITRTTKKTVDQFLIKSSEDIGLLDLCKIKKEIESYFAKEVLEKNINFVVDFGSCQNLRLKCKHKIIYKAVLLMLRVFCSSFKNCSINIGFYSKQGYSFVISCDMFFIKLDKLIEYNQEVLSGFGELLDINDVSLHQKKSEDKTVVEITFYEHGNVIPFQKRSVHISS